MMPLVFITAAFASSIGVAVLWVNPRRFTNQAFAIVSLLLVAELLLIYQAVSAGRSFEIDKTINPVPWVRANAIVIGFFPWALWLLKESIATSGNEIRKTIIRSTPWALLGFLLGLVCLSDSFIPQDSRHDNQKYGPAYMWRTALLIGALIYLIISTGRQVLRLGGIRRLEMKFLVVNGSMTAIVSVGLVRASALLDVPELKGLAIVVTLIGYGTMAWAMTIHRIFDVRQILLSVGQRALLIVLLGMAVMGLARLLDALVSPVASMLISFVVGVLALWRVDRIMRDWLGFGGEQSLAGARKSVMEMATRETDCSRLLSSFEGLLQELCHTSFVALVAEKVETRSSRWTIDARRPGFGALCEIGWATPESLERRRSSLGLADLEKILAESSLGLIIASPSGSRAPSLLVALGAKLNQWPYTYPEVQRLQRMAELMDNVLIHTRLTTEAALKAKVEDLAMVSRGLAHDLRNLITPVSSFLVYAERQMVAGSVEAEVHAAAKRSVQMMTDYIREALFFSNRCEARFEKVNLEAMLESVCDVVAAHAARRGIAIEVSEVPHLEFVGDPVMIKRLLVNLLSNAIDASSDDSSVEVSYSEERQGWMRLRVADRGCGIADEHMNRIFEPYFTTKNVGDDTRGYGLGLAICQKIVRLHGGSMSVCSEVGKGTTVSVDLVLRKDLGGRDGDLYQPVTAIPMFKMEHPT